MNARAVRSIAADPSELDLTPRPEHRFTFGLWTVGNPGADPFGKPTRTVPAPPETVRRLAALGVWGISFHEDDVVPPEETASQRRSCVEDLRRALDETGVVAAMAGTNLHADPVFKDGAFTSSDPRVRRLAVAKAMAAIDFASEFGVRTFVLWGGREGVEAPAAKPPLDALDRYRDAIDFLCAYIVDRGYDMRLALEPKPNEPRGDSFIPTVGHALAFISMLDRPEMVGVNPEFAHETMTGLSFYHAVALALWAGKLFHVDLNGQKIGRFDQDLRFGAEGLKEALFVVHLLESSDYDGPRHFDAHPFRNEDEEGIWEFALGCMRTYLALAAAARRFDADAEIQTALAGAGATALAVPAFARFTPAEGRALQEERRTADLDALRKQPFRNERLDQLTTELLLGLR